MTTRKLLILHPSSVVRRVLKGFVLSELDDVTTIEAQTGKEAKDIIKNQPIDIVLCAIYLKDVDGYDLYKWLQGSPERSMISFILFTSTNSQQQISEISEQGITDYLISPFSATELRDIINKVFNPRNLRQQQRYNIPDTKALIQFEEQQVEAEVINMSLGSIFCEFKLSDEKADLLEKSTASIQFSGEFEDIAISNIECRTLSIKTTQWSADNKPETVRIIFLFNQLSPEKRSVLAAILERVEEKNRTITAM